MKYYNNTITFKTLNAAGLTQGSCVRQNLIPIPIPI